MTGLQNNYQSSTGTIYKLASSALNEILPGSGFPGQIKETQTNCKDRELLCSAMPCRVPMQCCISSTNCCTLRTGTGLLGWNSWGWSPWSSLAAGLAEGGATHCSESRQLCEPVTRGTTVQGPWGPSQSLHSGA